MCQQWPMRKATFGSTEVLWYCSGGVNMLWYSWIRRNPCAWNFGDHKLSSVSNFRYSKWVSYWGDVLDCTNKLSEHMHAAPWVLADWSHWNSPNRSRWKSPANSPVVRWRVVLSKGPRDKQQHLPRLEGFHLILLLFHLFHNGNFLPQQPLLTLLAMRTSGCRKQRFEPVTVWCHAAFQGFQGEWWVYIGMVSSKEKNMLVILAKADPVSLQTECGHVQLAFR